MSLLVKHAAAWIYLGSVTQEKKEDGCYASN